MGTGNDDGRRSSEALYYRDPYISEFTARVVRVETPESNKEKKKAEATVVLDHTAFYPEGGGQPADHGFLGQARVVDVRKRGDEILHYLESNSPDGAPDSAPDIAPDIAEGAEIPCRVDWDRRFDFMQQHSGQHILSAVMYRDFGYQTVSVHQGSDTTSIEIEADSLEDKEVIEIENRALALIDENRDIKVFQIDERESSSYDLRREPKVSGSIRVVEIEGCDAVACGGVHTATTGEVRLIRHAGTERIRGRVRLHWKIGGRAVEDYREKSRIVSGLVDLFSTPQERLYGRISSFSQEYTDLRREYAVLEDRAAALEAEKLLMREGAFGEGAESGDGPTAAGMYNDSDAVGTGSTDEILVLTAAYSGESKDFLRKVAEALLEKTGGRVGTSTGGGEKSPEGSGGTAFCGVNATEKGLQWLIALDEEAERRIDFNSIKGDLLSPIGGKGGGKPPLRQGVGQKPEGLDDFFSRFRSLW